MIRVTDKLYVDKIRSVQILYDKVLDRQCIFVNGLNSYIRPTTLEMRKIVALADNKDEIVLD